MTSDCTEKKSSGVDWFGKIPQHWCCGHLKRFTNRIQAGMTPPTSTPEYYSDGTIPWFAPGSFNGDLDLCEPRKLISDRARSEGNLRIFPSETIFLVGIGATIGKVGLVSAEASCNQQLTGLVCGHRIYSRFLTYQFKIYEDVIPGIATSTTLPIFDQVKTGYLPVCLPPLPEQQRIAAYLDASCAAIDAAVAAKRRQLGTLDALRSSIISRAVTQGLNAKAAMKPSGLDWVPEVPAHWQVQQIKRLCSLVRGQFTHRPRNDPALYDGPYPFIQTGDITAAGKYIRTHSQTLNELGLSVSKQFPRGTLVMSIAANIGDVAILDFEACFPDSMIGMIPGYKANLDFLYYLMRSMRSIMLRSAVQSTQLNLNYVRIGTNFAPVPPLKEQAAIAEYLDAKEHESHLISSTIETQIITLTAYRKSLIHECVTGQRRITAADINRVKAHG